MDYLESGRRRTPLPPFLEALEAFTDDVRFRRMLRHSGLTVGYGNAAAITSAHTEHGGLMAFHPPAPGWCAQAAWAAQRSQRPARM